MHCLPAFVTMRPLYCCRSNSPSIVRLRSITPMPTVLAPPPRAPYSSEHLSRTHSNFRPCPRSPISLLSSQALPGRSSAKRSASKELKKVPGPHLEASVQCFSERRTITFQRGSEVAPAVAAERVSGRPSHCKHTQSDQRQSQSSQLSVNTKRSLPDQKPSAAQPQSTVRDEENQTEQVEEAYFPREMSAQAKEIIMQFKEKQQRELEQMNQTESQYQESSSCRKSGSEQKQQVSPKLMRILK